MTRRRRTQQLRAVVGRRGDFRESSRVVALWTRERGLVQVLAKGAHRKDSPFLGRLDGFNLVDATIGGGEGLPILHRVVLRHEPRALRAPARYQAAAWVAELLGGSFSSDRPDPDLFDLLTGGLTLVERAPPAALGTIVLGLELRLLELSGVLPALDGCTTCGRSPDGQPMFVAREGGGVQCEMHRPPAARSISAAALDWLRALRATPGRRWPELPPPPEAPRLAETLAIWLPHVLERPPRFRRGALAASARTEDAAASAQS